LLTKEDILTLKIYIDADGTCRATQVIE